MSGFREGWAVKRRDSRQHYFRREGAGIATSLCGAQDSPAGWLSADETAPSCARCMGLLQKERAGNRPGRPVGSLEGVLPSE